MNVNKLLEKHFTKLGCKGDVDDNTRQYQAAFDAINEAINYKRCSLQLPNIYEGTLNNDRIKIIRTLADNYNVGIDTIRSLFNDGADFYKQTLTK